jgi:hypothetical protein
VFPGVNQRHFYGKLAFQTIVKNRRNLVHFWGNGAIFITPTVLCRTRSLLLAVSRETASTTYPLSTRTLPGDNFFEGKDFNVPVLQIQDVNPGSIPNPKVKQAPDSRYPDLVISGYQDTGNFVQLPVS